MALTEIPVELSSTPGIVDSSNATAITIDSSERLLLGHTAARNVGYSDSAVFRIEGTSYPNASIATVLNSNNANGPSVVLGKSRGTSVGSNTVVQDDDNLGVIDFVGSDGGRETIGTLKFDYLSTESLDKLLNICSEEEESAEILVSFKVELM